MSTPLQENNKEQDINGRDIYHEVFDNAREAILILDPVLDRILDANTPACHLLGYSRDAFRALPASALHPHELPALIVFTQAVLHKGQGWTSELSCRSHSGENIPVEYSAARFEYEGEQRIVVILRDRDELQKLQKEAAAESYVRQGIADWKRIENIFQAIEHENKLILDAAGEGIYGINSDGQPPFVNPAAERMLGWPSDELVGKNIHSMIHHSYPDNTHYDAHNCPIYAAFRDGDIHTVDNEVFWCKDGTSLPVEYTSTPIRDNGYLVGAVVIFRDISERKEAEANLRAALEEVGELKRRLEMENAYLQEEMRSEHNYHEIVGKSVTIQQVIQQIELVAPTEANVIITGESGTGKELIAHAIHSISKRNQRPLIRVNCAVIPHNLFESEFFGHIKGAFTGAITDRIGRFELANGGTLFLDEVGEIPLELQSKLLRVLQEGQFERVGENKTREVDVRIIAATNRDLKQMVADQDFREDLNYRLNVFPIESAPLRNRLEDVPLLAMHLLERACNKQNKPGMRLTRADIERLQSYDWPGNIRELGNVIERAVIVSRGGKLKLDVPVERTRNMARPDSRVVSKRTEQDDILTMNEIRDLERRNIQAALQKSAGKVFGAGGAAELLDIKPTTLASRLKSLGIDKWKGQ